MATNLEIIGDLSTNGTNSTSLDINHMYTLVDPSSPDLVTLDNIKR